MKSNKPITRNEQIVGKTIGLNFVLGIILATLSFQKPIVHEDNTRLSLNSGISLISLYPHDEDKVLESMPQKRKPKTIMIAEEAVVVDKVIEVVEAPFEDAVDVSVDAVSSTTSTGLSEGDTSTVDDIVEFVDTEAKFPGGAAAMMKWINENVNYPQTSIEMNEQGRVYLSFVVEKDGSITNVKVERGVSWELDSEAVRMISLMPRWTPGESSGRSVRARCRLPINFQLQ